MADIGGWDARSDEQLVELAMAGGTERERSRAFTEIYDRHGPVVQRFCAAWLSDPTPVGDVVQETFARVFIDLRDGRPPRDPTALGSWIIGIARNRCRQAVQRRRELPSDDVEPVNDDVEVSSRRRDEVDRLLVVVADSFTEKQRRIFDLTIHQGLRGQRLAEALGVPPEQASRLTLELRQQAFKGFGALVLARDGRPYCSRLAEILDRAGWDGEHFSRSLRERIGRHLDTCSRCDDCATCRDQQRRLVAPYAPVLVPMLVAPTLRDQVHRSAEAIASHRSPPSSPPSPPEPPQPPGPSAPSAASRGLRPPLGPVPALALATALVIGGVTLVERARARDEATPTFESAASLEPLAAPNCDDLLADVFPRNEVEGWDNEELDGSVVSVLGMDIATRSIDVVASNPDQGPGFAIGLFIRDGRLVERIDSVPTESAASDRLQGVLEELYPPIPRADGEAGHRQGAAASFRRMSFEAGIEDRYIFEDCTEE